jgi:hypothetical protein
VAAERALFDWDDESGLLGRLMFGDSEWLDYARAAGITAETFHHSRHRVIFNAIATLADRDEPFDGVAVAVELQRTGDLERAGGKLAVLAHSNAGGLTLNSTPTYVTRVLDLAARRAVDQAADDLKRHCRNGFNPDATLAIAERIKEQITAPPGRSSLRVLSTAELLALPPPTYLLEPYLIRETLAVLFGPSGAYKSFIAIDWACRIAQREPVVYIAAEGAAGIPKRVRAWMQAAATPDVSEITWIPQSVDLTQPSAVDQLLRGIVTKPALVVIDTMARNMTGNENAPEDTGKVVHGCDTIREQWGSTVLLLHHTGHTETNRERGHSSLIGAADIRIGVQSDLPRQAVLTCHKVKDEDLFRDVYLRLKPIADSLVVAIDRPPAQHREDEIRAEIKALLSDDPGATKNAIETSTKGRASDVRQVLDHMIHEGVVVPEKGRGNAINHFLATTSSHPSDEPGRTAHGQTERARPNGRGYIEDIAPWDELDAPAPLTSSQQQDEPETLLFENHLENRPFAPVANDAEKEEFPF